MNKRQEIFKKWYKIYESNRTNRKQILKIKI